MGLSRFIRIGLIAASMLAAVPASAEQICSAAWESVTNPDHGTIRLSCPNGETIQSIDFASYGTPNPEPYYYDPDNFDVTSHLNPTLAPACEDLAAISLGSCDSNISVDVLEAYCLGESSCEVEATNDLFGDPCFGTYKRLYVIATCSDNRPPVCDTAQATPTSSGHRITSLCQSVSRASPTRMETW